MASTHKEKSDRMPKGSAGHETTPQRRRERQQVEHLGSLLRLAISAAQIRPVNVWAHVFAPDGALRFALNSHRKFFAARFAIGNISKMPNRRFAGGSKQLALVGAQIVKVCFEIHTPMIFTVWCCRQHLTVNSPFGCSVA